MNDLTPGETAAPARRSPSAARSHHFSDVLRSIRGKLGKIKQALNSNGEPLARQVAQLRQDLEDVSGEVRRLSALIASARDEASLLRRDYVAVNGRDMRNLQDQIEENYESFATPFEDYERLVDALRDMETIRLVPVCELLTAPADDRAVVALRHDIDADPETAARMARYLARFALPGSFYLLHTAPYYGDFHDGVFVRSPQLAAWVRSLIVAGCEIGIHNDAFGAAQHLGVDGAKALRTEIQWLRSHGAVIRGSVGHNSAPAYGAENSEVFVGRRLWDRSPQTTDERPLPLEALDESALELTYEGTFANQRKRVDRARAEGFVADLSAASIRNEAWMRTYLIENPCCDWAVDVQIWLIGAGRWVIGGRVRDRAIFHWNLDLPGVLRIVGELPARVRAIFVLHPEYYR